MSLENNIEDKISKMLKMVRGCTMTETPITELYYGTRSPSECEKWGMFNGCKGALC